MNDSTPNPGSDSWHWVDLGGFELELPPSVRGVDAITAAGNLRQFSIPGIALAISSFTRRVPFAGSLGLAGAAGSLSSAWMELGDVSERMLVDSEDHRDVVVDGDPHDPSRARVIAIRLADGDVGVVELVRPAWATEIDPVIDRIASSLRCSGTPSPRPR